MAGKEGRKAGRQAGRQAGRKGHTGEEQGSKVVSSNGSFHYKRFSSIISFNVTIIRLAVPVSRIFVTNKLARSLASGKAVLLL